MVEAPEGAKSALWQLVEFSKRLEVEEVWDKEIQDKNPEYKGKTLFEVLYANGQVNKYSLDEIPEDRLNHESCDFGFYLQKELFEEYASFGRGKAHDLAPYDRYHQERGLRWPVVDGKAVILLCLMCRQQKCQIELTIYGFQLAECSSIGIQAP